MEYRGFFCYKEYIEKPREALTPEQYKEYAVGLLELGIYGQYAYTDIIVAALLEEKAAMMKATDRRYRHSVFCGKLGGRRQIFTDAELMNAVVNKGICTQQGLANYFGCSLRTIQRRITSKEIRRFYNESHKAE